MKAYISESELYPCYGVRLKPNTYDPVVDVPEETIRKWCEISILFHKAQSEIEQAIRDYERKQEEIKHLQSCFAKVNPSRTDKGYILSRFGWEQVDTSLWEKDGRQVRLHEAYAECKQNFEQEETHDPALQKQQD